MVRSTRQRIHPWQVFVQCLPLPSLLKHVKCQSCEMVQADGSRMSIRTTTMARRYTLTSYSILDLFNHSGLASFANAPKHFH